MGFICLHRHDLHSGDLQQKDPETVRGRLLWGTGRGLGRKLGLFYFYLLSTHFHLLCTFFFFYIKGVTSNHFSFNLRRQRYAICMAIIIYLYFH